MAQCRHQRNPRRGNRTDAGGQRRPHRVRSGNHRTGSDHGRTGEDCGSKAGQVTIAVPSGPENPSSHTGSLGCGRYTRDGGVDPTGSTPPLIDCGLACFSDRCRPESWCDAGASAGAWSGARTGAGAEPPLRTSERVSEPAAPAEPALPQARRNLRRLSRSSIGCV
jgi:hypothetical protein